MIPASLTKMTKTRQSRKRKASNEASLNGSNGEGLLDGVPAFLTKLYNMISECDRKDPHVACWDEDGSHFTVKDKEALAKLYIPKFFDSKQYASLDRQLNFYSFQKSYLLEDGTAAKSSKESKQLGYCHEYFHRDRPELLPKIQRISKSRGGKTAGDDASRQQTEEVEALQQEVASLTSLVQQMKSEMEHKMASMKSEFHEKIERLREEQQKCNKTADENDYASRPAKRFSLFAPFSAQKSLISLKGGEVETELDRLAFNELQPADAKKRVSIRAPGETGISSEELDRLDFSMHPPPADGKKRVSFRSSFSWLEKAQSLRDLFADVRDDDEEEGGDFARDIEHRQEQQAALEPIPYDTSRGNSQLKRARLSKNTSLAQFISRVITDEGGLF